ncbi:cobalamin-binding protein [Methylophilus sp. UBA6697]|jgi:iron complex transport system substrate-binding protein|uniref:cobalamin-binding protein n=1 Tax=Methylophilus sp. UBA6697 TaxID=1946902 RepID=UPI000EE8D543|nr:cobalamin-binding protein [Methylophilus sp. UBA6697]HCU83830.1 cobalamin-binding protein [Methylophilus sp.]
MKRWPQRIVCLTTETVEVLYLLGEQDRIVGISGFTTRPAIARKEKPKISAFTSANIEKILALQPDLVLCFSNLQADIAASLIKAGCQVHVFNQRSLDETLQMILTVGDLVGASDKAKQLVERYQAQLDAARLQASSWPRKPRVYFEEWDEPMMCSIRWAAELIEAAGGEDCFPELSQFHSAKDRQVSAEQVLARQPDIIIGSWCGKKFQPEKIKARPGWQAIPAIQNGHLYEIKSVDILQPGPALFTEGLAQLQTIIQRWQQQGSHA